MHEFSRGDFTFDVTDHGQSDAPEAAITARGGKNFLRGLVNSGLSAEAAERYAAPLRDRTAARAAVNWYRGLPLARAPRGKVAVPALYVYATGDRFLGRKAADLT